MSLYVVPTDREEEGEEILAQGIVTLSLDDAIAVGAAIPKPSFGAIAAGREDRSAGDDLRAFAVDLGASATVVDPPATERSVSASDIITSELERRMATIETAVRRLETLLEEKVIGAESKLAQLQAEVQDRALQHKEDMRSLLASYDRIAAGLVKASLPGITIEGDKRVSIPESLAAENDEFAEEPRASSSRVTLDDLRAVEMVYTAVDDDDEPFVQW
jgi:hypothetical protein